MGNSVSRAPAGKFAELDEPSLPQVRPNDKAVDDDLGTP